jgi:hypothetical protein
MFAVIEIRRNRFENVSILIFLFSEILRQQVFAPVPCDKLVILTRTTRQLRRLRRARAGHGSLWKPLIHPLARLKVLMKFNC